MLHRKHRIGGLAAVLVIFAAAALALGAGPADKTFLWRVQSETGTVFLLGSLHFARPEMYPVDQRILDAFNESDRLVVEVDLNRVDQKRLQDLMTANGFYASGDSLADHLTPETAARMADMGYDVRSFGQARPWLAAVTLQAQTLQKLGYQDGLGVDKHFLDRAERAGKPVEALEDIDFQIKLMAGFSEAVEDLFLRAVLIEMADMEDALNRLFRFWLQGDADRFANEFLAEYGEFPELAPVAEGVIFQRNDKMAAAVEKLLKRNDTSFVIVGAGHLVGERGVLRQLRAKGYRIEQI